MMRDDPRGEKVQFAGGTRDQSAAPASVRVVQFSRELRDDVLAGDITLSVRLWARPQVKEGGRYRIELHAVGRED